MVYQNDGLKQGKYCLVSEIKFVDSQDRTHTEEEEDLFQGNFNTPYFQSVDQYCRHVYSLYISIYS